MAVKKEPTVEQLQQQLRAVKAEKEIQRQVILHLQDDLKTVLENQQRMTETLLLYSDMINDQLAGLAIYRGQTLRQTKQALDHIRSGHGCVPGCKQHRWDVEKGWVSTQ